MKQDTSSLYENVSLPSSEKGNANLDKDKARLIDQQVSVQSEVVSRIVGEDIPAGSSAVVQSRSFLWSISHRVSDLVRGTKEKHSQVLPSLKEQEKEVRLALEKEKSFLIKEAKRLEASRRFSADALEKVLFRLRVVQKTLSDLFLMASEKVEALYRKYVLKQI